VSAASRQKHVVLIAGMPYASIDFFCGAVLEVVELIDKKL
jgi:hypothetical protein